MKVDAVKSFMERALPHFKTKDKAYSAVMREFATEARKCPIRAHIASEDYFRDTMCKIWEDKDACCRKMDEIVSDSQAKGLDGVRLNNAATKSKANTTFAAMGALLGLIGLVGDAENSIYNDEEVAKLYPKTLKLRKSLGNRMRMDKVVPKMNWSEKLEVIPLIKDVRTLYPKTLALRTRLIQNGRIKEDRVTSKMFLLKKLLYKKYFNN